MHVSAASAEDIFHIYIKYITKLMDNYLLISWSRVLPEKLASSQLFRKLPNSMEPEGSLPHLQVPGTCPYPEPDQSSLCPHPIPLPEDSS